MLLTLYSTPNGDFDTAYDAFHDRLTTGWSETPLVFENERFDLPDIPASFVYVEVFGDTLNQESIGAPGANTWLETGVTYLHVMVPYNTGTSTARRQASQLLNLFREQPIGALMMAEMSIGAGHPGRDFPNYFSLAATIFWERRDITSITL